MADGSKKCSSRNVVVDVILGKNTVYVFSYTKQDVMNCVNV